jgi:hypothetical protein
MCFIFKKIVLRPFDSISADFQDKLDRKGLESASVQILFFVFFIQF